MIQESIKKGLSQKQKRIQIAFVMPNDEGKYYRDLPQDLEGLLLAEFGVALNDIEIQVSFISFKFGDSIKDRPYIDKAKNVIKVAPQEISSYLPLALERPVRIEQKE